MGADPWAIDAVWETATDALHADREHDGDWYDPVCSCEDDVAVVLRAAKVEGLGKRVAELESLLRGVLDYTGRHQCAVEACEISRAAAYLDAGQPDPVGQPTQPATDGDCPNPSGTCAGHVGPYCIPATDGVSADG